LSLESIFAWKHPLTQDGLVKSILQMTFAMEGTDEARPKNGIHRLKSQGMSPMVNRKILIPQQIVQSG
jgi:hypothetical protein